MIIRGESVEKYSFLLSLCSLSFFLLFFVFAWLYFRTFSYYQKKIDKISQSIVEELGKK